MPRSEFFMPISARHFPDLKVKREDMFGEGDKTVAPISLAGTHTGNALGR